MEPDSKLQSATTGQPRSGAARSRGESSAGETTPERASDAAPAEIGGRGGLDPTRYGDWEKNGRCIDF